MTKTFSRRGTTSNGTYRTYRTYGTYILGILLVGLAGCVRLGERVQFGGALAGAPKPAEVLAELAANDEAIKNFSATGKIKLQSPKFEAVKMFEDGHIAFRRPADLSLQGKTLVGMEVFRLTSVGSEFLIDFPATHDQPYYRVEGEQFASVPFSVSPSEIAQEMFLPEDWTKLSRHDVRLVSYDTQAKTAVLEIGPKNDPRRRITVMGPPWVVIKNERLVNGQVVAVTTKGDYRDENGIRFPAFIDAWFPGEETRLTFNMRRININGEVKPELFDIKSRAHEWGIKVQ